MKVTTTEPLKMEEMIAMSKTHDARIELGDFKCRYLMASPGQEIEVDYTYYKDGLAFGLRKAKSSNGLYDYLAYRIY